MSALLDDIITIAIDGNRPLPDILRKCLVVGSRVEKRAFEGLGESGT